MLYCLVRFAYSFILYIVIVLFVLYCVLTKTYIKWGIPRVMEEDRIFLKFSGEKVLTKTRINLKPLETP